MKPRRALATLTIFALALTGAVGLLGGSSRPLHAQASCPAALPPAINFTGPAVTQGQFKLAITGLVSFLGCLLGTDGSVSAARSALGLAVVASSGSYADLSGKPSLTLGGDLSGSLGAAMVAKVQGRGVSTSTPANGQALVFVGGTQLWTPTTLATVATTGSYNDLINRPSSFPPSGAAGGALTGSYPNPGIASTGIAPGTYGGGGGANGTGQQISTITVGADGRVISISVTDNPPQSPGGGG